MTKQRRTLSAEFKREAADFVLRQNYSYIEASPSLGIGESALRRRVDQVQKERQGVTPQSKALTPEQQKIQELEPRIARLEREKSILTSVSPYALTILISNNCFCALFDQRLESRATNFDQG